MIEIELNEKRREIEQSIERNRLLQNEISNLRNELENTRRRIGKINKY